MSTGVAQTIVGFARDEDGDHVALLDCGHRRHVRHRPPLSSYPWVLEESGRNARIGAALECARCLRREPPASLAPYRQTASFDETSLPGGLLRDHQTKAGVWARVCVTAGALTLELAAPAGARVTVTPDAPALIPPTLRHAVRLDGPVRFHVEFLRPDATG
ncbi:MAG: DUF3565 domain-containing protein [Nannocystaceae bacterium]|nr:DUF3565 domain-containing protein [Myxococcales bacterium]